MDLTNKKILVTGATGKLGQQLIYEFSKLGVKPIAQVRNSSNTSYIDSIGLEKRTADLCFTNELPGLVDGIDYLIHTAAIVNFRQDRFTQFAGTNTIAAADLYRAAASAGVKRFVHVSTVGAIGAVPRNRNSDYFRGDSHLANEKHKFNLQKLRIPYLLTKHAAEQELLKLAKDCSTELVIVNPSIVMAPSRTRNDRAKASKILAKLVVPDIPNRLNLVDIRDVTKGIIAALEHGGHGERYILGGDNITARDLALAASAELGKAPHLFRYPKNLFKFAANLSVLLSRLTGRSKISFYPDLVRLLDYDWAFSSMKARNELGYRNRSIYITLRDLLNNNFIDTYLKPLRNNN